MNDGPDLSLEDGRTARAATSTPQWVAATRCGSLPASVRGLRLPDDARTTGSPTQTIGRVSGSRPGSRNCEYSETGGTGHDEPRYEAEAGAYRNSDKVAGHSLP